VATPFFTKQRPQHDPPLREGSPRPREGTTTTIAATPATQAATTLAAQLSMVVTACTTLSSSVRPTSC